MLTEIKTIEGGQKESQRLDLYKKNVQLRLEKSYSVKFGSKYARCV